MNLKGRYALVVVVSVTFLVVYYLPYGCHESKCKKCLDCSEILNEFSALPNIQRDMVVMRSSEIGNKSFEELRLLRLKQILNEQRLEPKPLGLSGLKVLGDENFVLNCVTHSKLLEKNRTETYAKHIFQHSENSTSSADQNVTIVRGKWLKQLRKMDFDVEKLVTLNVLLTHIKLDLNKEFISVLDVFCGDIQNTVMQDALRYRDDLHYTGIDTSSTVISKNKKTAHSFGADPRFHVFDILLQKLNRQFDLVVILNSEGFLNSEQIAVLLQRVSQSGSMFILTDFHLMNHAVLPNWKNNEHNVQQTWDLRIHPNRFELDFPICFNQFKDDKIWMLWKLPLQQITVKL